MMRVGIGYDSHRFAAGRPFILGGISGFLDTRASTVTPTPTRWPTPLTDAILGAAGAGDIGTHFPDSDPRWKDADSLRILRQAAEEIRRRGFTPCQVDVTVILERPRLGVYKEAIARAIAGELGIHDDRVGIKAKTNEGMGFIGRGEGVAVIAVATVEGP